jgi:hypothetical protein
MYCIILRAHLAVISFISHIWYGQVAGLQLLLPFRYLHNKLQQSNREADPSGREVYDMGLRPLAWITGSIPPMAWMSVSCECCVLSGRGLCVWLVTRPDESYGLWCVQ